MFLDSDLAVGSHPVQAIYGGDSQNQGSQSRVLTQQVQGCTVSTHLIKNGTILLDLPATSPTLHVQVGKAMLTVEKVAVSYCADPGRPSTQATLTGTISTGTGLFAKGDTVTLQLRTRPVGHGAEALLAVLTDQTSKRRLALLGPFDTGSRIQITTS